MILPNDTLTEIIDTLTELKRMHQLNLELFEQLNVACGWLLEHKIPVPNASTFYSLLVKAKALLIEIQAETPKMLHYPKLSDGSYHDDESDDKLPEPEVWF